MRDREDFTFAIGAKRRWMGPPLFREPGDKSIWAKSRGWFGYGHPKHERDAAIETHWIGNILGNIAKIRWHFKKLHENAQSGAWIDCGTTQRGLDSNKSSGKNLVVFAILYLIQGSHGTKPMKLEWYVHFRTKSSLLGLGHKFSFPTQKETPAMGYRKKTETQSQSFITNLNLIRN